MLEGLSAAFRIAVHAWALVQGTVAHSPALHRHWRSSPDAFHFYKCKGGDGLDPYPWEGPGVNSSLHDEGHRGCYLGQDIRQAYVYAIAFL